MCCRSWDKHKKAWQRRLAAIDLDRIDRWGEETVFTLEFKHAIFEDAVLEYLDSHGHAELAAEVRENEVLPWPVAIQGTAMTEGLSELAAQMDGDDAFEACKEAQRILIDKKHVTLEWDLLLKNALRRRNRDKAFLCICNKCGAGYEEYFWRCWACDENTIVEREVWEQQVAREQQTLEAELQAELQRCQRERKRREKSACRRRRQYLIARYEKINAREEKLARQRLEAAPWHPMVEGYYPAGLDRLCAQQTKARAKFASSYEDVVERKGLMRRTR